MCFVSEEGCKLLETVEYYIFMREQHWDMVHALYVLMQHNAAEQDNWVMCLGMCVSV